MPDDKKGSPHDSFETDPVDGSYSASCAMLVAVECDEPEGAAQLHGIIQVAMG
jgi:hypothetical protein